MNILLSARWALAFLVSDYPVHKHTALVLLKPDCMTAAKQLILTQMRK